MKILYYISFKSSFFKNIENVINLFKNEFGEIIDYSKCRSLFKLIYFRKNKNQIITERYEPEIYNNFIKMYFIEVEEKTI